MSLTHRSDLLAHPWGLSRVGAFVGLAALGLLLSLAGCSSQAEDDDDAIIIDGCSPPCRAGFVCQNNQCVPKQDGNPAEGGSVGSACSDHAACDTGTCLSGKGIPGGYCSKPCGARVSNHGSECPAGSACLQVSNAASYCLQGCSGPADCRSGYACIEAQGTSVCLPRCQSSDDCGAGQYCNADTGQCERRDDQSTEGQLGSSCRSDAQCNGTSCLTEQATEGSFPGGYCATGCSAAREASTCHDGQGLCVGFPGDNGKTYTCLQKCTAGSECRAGYICSADTGVANDQGQGFCWPHCNNYQCDTGFQCDAATGICQESDGGGMDGPEVAHRRIWQGEVDNQGVQKLTFQVPDDAYAFSIVSTPTRDNTTPIVVRLDAPGGEVLFDARSPFNSKIDLFPYQNTRGDGHHSFLIPNAPSYRAQNGQYTLWLAASARTDLRVDLLLKKGTVQGQKNKLPLTFWVLPQQHLSADGAAANRKLQQALSTFKEIYRRMGVEIGPVRFFDVTGNRARDLAVVDEGQFTDLWSVIDRNRAEGLNFVVVDHFSGNGGGGQTLGRSGGIPGPPTHSSSPAGGVAVSAAVLPQRDGAYFGSVMAHEAGHYLGLRHTTEQPGTVFDPLRDTPRCTARRDANGNGVVEPDECRGSGTQNLMFWAANQLRPKKVTAGQAFVIQHNPSLK